MAFAPVKLTPGTFTERLEPIFRSVESRLPKHLRARRAEYFFPKWRELMQLGIAHAWEIPDAVLGCTITPDLFSGALSAYVVFWFSKPGTSGTLELLRAAEAGARLAGCKRIGIAAFGVLEGERIASIYEHAGFSELEKTFSKELL
jgi:hypothetical protein